MSRVSKLTRIELSRGEEADDDAKRTMAQDDAVAMARDLRHLQVSEGTRRVPKDREGRWLRGDADGAGTRVCAVDARGKTRTYAVARVVGKGSFGVVYQAEWMEEKRVVAVKKVMQDRRFKNRELEVMLGMPPHPNVVELLHCFYSRGRGGEVYLNLVLEFVRGTVFHVAKLHAREKQPVPIELAKYYAYQTLSALDHLHRNGVCHRDVKPHNLLVRTDDHVLKLCDFGSAKPLVAGEPNISYICSRYYRAPELIFGAAKYTTAIDVWSAGCVLAELMLGKPIFAGKSSVDQLAEIVKVLGPPTHAEIMDMNASPGSIKFPDVKRVKKLEVLEAKGVGEDARDLLSKMLVYAPTARLTAREAMNHPFFRTLQQEDLLLPGGVPVSQEVMLAARQASTSAPDGRVEQPS